MVVGGETFWATADVVIVWPPVPSPRGSCKQLGFPTFVGRVDRKVKKNMDWVATRIQEHMQGDVDKWVLEVLSQQLNL